MATVKVKPNLPAISTSKTHKKYLGEPNSPHYIPSSPLIDRQFLSHKEEDELKKTCALVLANVQSSDDDVDQSFTYLASQIQEKEKTANHSKKPSVPLQTSSTAVGRPEPLKVVNQPTEDSKPQTARSNSMAPMSAVSDRTASSQTDFSTAPTSAGITPGETAKRTSGPKSGFLGLKRGSTGSQGSKTAAASAQNHNNTANQDAVASADRALAWMNSYLEKRVSSKSEPQHPSSSSAADHASRKSSARLSATASTTSAAARTRNHRRKHDSRGSLGGPMELNKRLPALPGQPEVERAKHITRLMKTIRRQNAEPTQTEPRSQWQFDSQRGESTPSASSRLGSAQGFSMPQQQHHYQQQQQVTHSLPTTSHQQHHHAPMTMRLGSISEPVSPAPKSQGGRKRMGFRSQFIGRFEWKRQKGPLVVAPVLQTV